MASAAIAPVLTPPDTAIVAAAVPSSIFLVDVMVTPH